MRNRRAQIMQRDDRSDERADVEDQKLVVGCDRERPFAVCVTLLEAFEIWQQVEDVLQILYYLMIDWHLPADH